jgi:putative inorganic carbon (HCO3(-)) transporter
VYWWGLIEWVCLLLITPLLLFTSPNLAPLLLVIPTLWGIRRLILGRFVPHTPVDLVILVLMVMGGVGFSVSPNPAWSHLKINSLLLGVGFLYATVDLLTHPVRLRWVPAGVVTLGSAFLALGLIGTRWVLKIPRLGTLTGGLPSELAWLPKGETTFNPNVIGGALLWVLPLALSLLIWALQSWERRWRLAAAEGVTVILCLGLLFLTQARGAWIGFLAGLLTILGIAGGRLMRAGVAMSLATLLVLVASMAVRSDQLACVSEESIPLLSTVSIQHRLQIWSRAQYAIADFPFTGLGLDAFQYVMPVMYPLVQVQLDTLVPHAHNEFLQMALDVGLPGLVAWQALYIGTFSMLWRAYRRGSSTLVQPLALGSGAALIAHLAYSMTDCAILDAKPNIVFWLVIGLSTALYKTVDRTGSTAFGDNLPADGH